MITNLVTLLSDAGYLVARVDGGSSVVVLAHDDGAPLSAYDRQAVRSLCDGYMADTHSTGSIKDLGRCIIKIEVE